VVHHRPLLSIVFLALVSSAVLTFAAPARADVLITVTDFSFSPQDVTIAPGETVTWVFKKGFHTTTNGLGDADPQAGSLWDEFVFAGQPTVSHTFATAGVVPYFCRFHESLNMKGTVTVVAPTATTPTSWGAVKTLFQ